MTTTTRQPAPEAAATAATAAIPTRTASAVRPAAVVGGVSLVAMAALAVPANLAVQQALGADGASAATDWLAGHAGAARFAVLALLAAAVLDVVVAWALATVLRPAGEGLATLAGWLRVAYAGMFVAAIGHLASAVRTATSGDATDATDAQAAWVAVHAFGDAWQLALAVFGVHLALVGVLLWRGSAPRALGAVVALAGGAYVLDALLRLLAVHAGVAGTVSTAVVAVLGLVGEVWLAGWLVLRAGRR